MDQPNPLAPTASPDDLGLVEDTTLEIAVAVRPDQLPQAQQILITRCRQQERALTKELADLQEHQTIAKANGWKLQAVKTQLTRARQRLLYYQKVRTVLEAGYLLVPNMPVDLLAVRKREGQPQRGAQTTTNRWQKSFTVAADILPPGDGTYVDDQIGYYDETSRIPNGKGGVDVHTLHVSADHYAPPDFPVRFVAPQVLQQAQAGMALRVFDEIGMVSQSASTRGRDPILVGRILSSQDWRTRRVATFFLAWWLDPQQL